MSEKNYNQTGVGQSAQFGKNGPSIERDTQALDHRTNAGALAITRSADAVGQDDNTTRRQWNVNQVTQLAWYVDPSGGNDTTGDGTIGNPLQTLREVAKRFGPEPYLANNVEVFVRSGGAPPIANGDAIIFRDLRSNLGARLLIRPYNTTVVTSGTIVSYTAQDAAALVEGQVVAGAGELAGAANNVLVISRGASVIAYAAAYADNGNDTANIAVPYADDGNTVTLLPGDTFDVVVPTQMFVNDCYVSAAGAPVGGIVRIFHAGFTASVEADGPGDSEYGCVRFVGCGFPGFVGPNSKAQWIACVGQASANGGVMALRGCAGSAVTHAVGVGGQLLVENSACSAVIASNNALADINLTVFRGAATGNARVTALSDALVILSGIYGLAGSEYGVRVQNGAQVVTNTSLNDLTTLTGSGGDIVMDAANRIQWSDVPYRSPVTGAMIGPLLSTGALPSNLGAGPAAANTFLRVTEADWYIDPQSGDDSNTGLSASYPLQSFQELQRRWGPNPLIDQDVTVHVLDTGTDANFTGVMELEATVTLTAQLTIEAERVGGDAAIGTIVSDTPQNSSGATPNLGTLLFSDPHGASVGDLIINDSVQGAPPTLARCWALVDKVLSPTEIRYTQFFLSPSNAVINIPGGGAPGGLNGTSVSRRTPLQWILGCNLRIRRAGWVPGGPAPQATPCVVRWFQFNSPGNVSVEAFGRYSSVEFQGCTFSAGTIGAGGQVSFAKCGFLAGALFSSVGALITGCSWYQGQSVQGANVRDDSTQRLGGPRVEQYMASLISIERGAAMEQFNVGVEDLAGYTLDDTSCYLFFQDIFGTSLATNLVTMDNGGNVDFNAFPASPPVSAGALFRTPANRSIDDAPFNEFRQGSVVTISTDGTEVRTQTTGDTANSSRAGAYVMTGNGRAVFWDNPTTWPAAETSVGAWLRGTGTSFDRFSYTAPGDSQRYWVPFVTNIKGQETSLFSVVTNNVGDGIMDTIED